MATSSKVQGAPNLIDSARIEWKLGKYGVGQGKDLKNPSVWQRTQEYRRVQASRLVPIEKKDIRSRLPAGEYHLSRKVDGELAVLWFEGGEALLVNPGGTVRVGLPLLVDAAKKLGKASVKSALPVVPVRAFTMSEVPRVPPAPKRIWIDSVSRCLIS